MSNSDAACRADYENRYHKIAADLGYDSYKRIWDAALNFAASERPTAPAYLAGLEYAAKVLDTYFDHNCADAAEQLRLLINAPVATMPEEKPTGQVYGIIDPDYGRIYTMVRKLAWEEGYAIGLHGSFTRDLDLIAVPWEAGRNCKPEKLVARILQATGMTEARPGCKGSPGDKPYGRLVWTLLLPEFGDPRFVDLSIMPTIVVEVAP